MAECDGVGVFVKAPLDMAECSIDIAEYSVAADESPIKHSVHAFFVELMGSRFSVSKGKYRNVL